MGSEDMILVDGLPIALRPFEESDRSFVIATWLQSARRAPQHKRQPWFCKALHPKVVKHLEHDVVRIACVAEQPSMIVSWACTRDGELIYAYTVKNKNVNFRGQGLVRALTSKEETHESDTSSSPT